MQRQRYLKYDLPRPIIPLFQSQIIQLSTYMRGLGYWLINNPTEYVTFDLVNLGVDKEYLSAADYDRFVFWPDYNIAGRIRDIVYRLKEAGVYAATVGELHRLTGKKAGSPTQFVSLTEEVILENSFDPLNPVNQRIMLNLNRRESQGKRVGLLPYSYHDGKLVFLLAKNNEEKHWASSGFWTDFGGGPENNETPAQTAAREGFEESMGILGSYDEILADISTSKTYDFAGGILIPYKIDYEEASYWPDIYKRVYKYSSACFKDTFLGTKTAPCCPEGYFEKVEMEWFQHAYIERNPNLFIRQLTRGIDHLVSKKVFV